MTSITTLIGNVGKEPEVRSMNNGGKVTNFSIAVNERRGDKDITEWYNVVAWGENATVAERFKKGQRVIAYGKFQTRKWKDKQGNERYSFELHADAYRGVVAPAPLPPKKGEGRSSSGSDMASSIDDDIPW